MIGNKKIEESDLSFFPKRPFLHFVIHLVLLFITLAVLSWLMSVGIRGFGSTGLYRSVFADNEDYFKQTKLFEIEESSYSPESAVLFVGSTGFFEEKTQGIKLSECINDSIFLEIPAYHYRDIKYAKSKDGLASFEKLKFKNIVFENNIALWTGIATEGTKTKMDLWGRSLVKSDHFFNKSDISLFFKYSKAVVYEVLAKKNNKSKKDRLPGYFFKSSKADIKLLKNKAPVTLFFNPKSPDFMTSDSFMNYKKYFKDISNKSIMQLHSTEDIKTLLGC